MTPAIVRKIFAKELRETLRDRRTLLVMLVVPIFLYPALLIVMQQLAIFGQRQLQEAPASVLAQGADEEILGRLRSDNRLSVVTADTAGVEGVLSGDADVFLQFSRGAEQGDARSVNLFFDASRDRSRVGREVVIESLREWEDSILEARLAERGLPPAFANPVIVADSSVATPARMGGYALGRFLPMLLILMTLLGAFYPAIDLSAGEKERGTLETILTTPVQAGDFVAGKFLAVTVVGIAAAALNLVSMLLTFRLAAFQFAQGVAIEFTLPWTTIALVMIALVPLTVLFASLFLGIALRAQSFKEAQNALTPVQLASMIPIMLPIIPGMPLNYVLALVPVGGLALLFREMMSGGAPIGPGLVAVAATVLYAGMALRFAAASFGREEVLFGAQSDPLSAGDWLARLRSGARKGPPTPGQAAVCIGIVALIFFYVAPLLTSALGELGIMASQFLLLGLPAVAFVLILRIPLRDGLGIRPPAGRHLFGGLLMAAGGLPVAWTLGWLQSFLLEIPEEYLVAFEDLVRADTPGEVLWLLLLVAVTPAICEELVFRGVLLRGLGTRLPMARAVAASALIFGLFHLSNETAIRLLPSAWLGLLLGYAAWMSRSLFVSMAMHFVNNGSIVALLAWPSVQDRVSRPSGAPEWWLMPMGIVLLAFGGKLLAGKTTGVDR